jgi:hypothetical protein
MKLVGVGAISVMLNYLLFGKLLHKHELESEPKRIRNMIMNEVIQNEKSQVDLLNVRK